MPPKLSTWKNRTQQGSNLPLGLSALRQAQTRIDDLVQAVISRYPELPVQTTVRMLRDLFRVLFLDAIHNGSTFIPEFGAVILWPSEHRGFGYPLLILRPPAATITDLRRVANAIKQTGLLKTIPAALLVNYIAMGHAADVPGWNDTVKAAKLPKESLYDDASRLCGIRNAERIKRRRSNTAGPNPTNH
jgi:hypothetical protein